MLIFLNTVKAQNSIFHSHKISIKNYNRIVVDYFEINQCKKAVAHRMCQTRFYWKKNPVQKSAWFAFVLSIYQKYMLYVYRVNVNTHFIQHISVLHSVVMWDRNSSVLKRFENQHFSRNCFHSVCVCVCAAHQYSYILYRVIKSGTVYVYTDFFGLRFVHFYSHAFK